jgi:hypothetical protein
MAQEVVKQYIRYAKLMVSRKSGRYAGIEFRNLRIVFDIEKTRTSEANKGNIQIYNLNQDHWTIFETHKDLFVVLYVSYNDPKNYEILFTGNVNKCSTAKDGVNIVTSIESGDGQKALQNARLEKTFKAGQIIKDAAKDVVDTFKDVANVAIKAVDDVITGNSGLSFSFSGQSKDLMDNLAKKFNFDWSIQNNQVVMKAKSTPIDNYAVDINFRTGLIGCPVRTEKGINLTALINPKVFPMKKIYVYSEGLSTVDDFFRVEKVTYKGDTHGNDWTMDIEANLVK